MHIHTQQWSLTPCLACAPSLPLLPRRTLCTITIQARYDWAPIMEGGRIIGVQKAGQSVTLEPGGQFELSGAPVATLMDTCAEVNSHLEQVMYNDSPEAALRRLSSDGCPYN